jgi:hypothetical protein
MKLEALLNTRLKYCIPRYFTDTGAFSYAAYPEPHLLFLPLE